VFIAFIGIIFLVSSGFTAFFFQHQRKTMEEYLKNSGIILSSILAYNSKIGVFSENKKLLMEPVSGIFQQNDVTNISIFNQKGDLLIQMERFENVVKEKDVITGGSLTSEMLEKLRVFKLPLSIERKKKIDFWAKVLSGSSVPHGEALFFKEKFVPQKDKVIGFVKVTIGKNMLDRALIFLFIKSIVMGIIFLIAGALIIYFVIISITKPLYRLTEGVKALGSKGIIEKLRVEGNDEIGKLANAFNDLYESLDRKNSEKKQLEDQLRHSQKLEAIGTLAGGIAHDFNNMLGIIMGYTELALFDVSDSDSVHRNLKQVLTASNRAADLVNQILVFSRKDKGRLKPIQLPAIVAEALKMLRSSLPSTIEMRQNIKPDLAWILADPIQIHSLIMNLCANAAHAIGKDIGSVKIDVEDVEIDSKTASGHRDLSPGSYQKVTVSDTGIGMTPEIMDRIFDPFFTTKEPGEGTGMGLSMVHGIVKRHKGAMSVQSKPGKGTKFDFFFPIIENKEIEEVKSPSLITEGHGQILFVDDEKDIVDMGKKIIENFGYQVVGVEDSMEALEIFKNNPDDFDLVISDITMPNITGEDFAKKILSIKPDIPIILCTGYSDIISERHAKKIGIKKYIMKPFSGQKIAEAINEVFNENEQKQKSSKPA